MDLEYPINQRVRDLMKALGYKGEKTDAHNFGKKVLGEGERTEKFKNAYGDKNGVSSEILSLITRNIVNEKGQKPNGHWLLTGKKQMFLPEKGTAATNNDEAAVTKEREALIKDLEAFRTIASQQSVVILNLSGGVSQAVKEA